MKSSLLTHSLYLCTAIVTILTLFKLPFSAIIPDLIISSRNKINLVSASLPTNQTDKHLVSVVAADKMNVLYVGVENPITVAAANIPLDNLKVSISTKNNIAKLIPTKDKQNYKVLVREYSREKVQIVVEDSTNKAESQTHEFRVKRIPEPIPSLPITTGPGVVTSGAMRASASTNIWLEIPCFDFNAECILLSFTFEYTAKRKTPIEINITECGKRFPKKIQDEIMKARPGVVYRFGNINAICPADEHSRRLGDIEYRIR